MEAPVEFRILGPLEVAYDGGAPVALPGTRQCSVLAVLLLHRNEVVSTERLVEQLWPEAPPARAAHAVQVFVSRIRTALGPAKTRLMTRPTGYLLQLDGDELDAARCELLYGEARAALTAGDAHKADALLGRALALWRGQPLAEFMYALRVRRARPSAQRRRHPPDQAHESVGRRDASDRGYPIVSNVSGVEPGIYHYDAHGHRLELLSTPGAGEVRTTVTSLLAGQDYFGDAHVSIVLTARFFRNHWKYRRHQKAYPGILMDAAHLSQTLYLVATELGLGAYVTLAINGRELEQRLGLDGVAEGVIAVCGCGVRSGGDSPLELGFSRS